ncbi:unnamed protein product [Parascedosporium putredinis]|uniref:Protein kinase domain-containing protein n=1 Tax=Parascedosporium putredinis TaxID=1442378 RepID=A0A9P1GWZ5_9PEZI|nr:unnamed protein product [Parascedosporium putredinis]CAI7990079.1 unnamed protein product [Parascedosporium putredinis]
MGDPFAPRSMKRKNVKGLALTPAAAKPPRLAESKNEDEQQLEIGIEYKLDLKPEDLDILKELGSGNGGTVSKVKHLTTGTVMARKVIHVEANKEMRKRIVRELQIMHGCHSDYIVTFYGAFLNDNNDVIMCMEYMDVGSLDRVSRVFGPIRVDVLGKIAEATLGGLTYLYSKHHIMHRDIKPSNILVNSRGGIKLCDFGVSGELINSIADTFVGTSTYMAPERIQGKSTRSNADLEDADCAPAGCMSKVPDERPTPEELFDKDPFVQAAKRTPVDLQEWAVGLMEKDNRKSHLAPQLSPATQELLRSTDSPTFFQHQATQQQQPHQLQLPTSRACPSTLWRLRRRGNSHRRSGHHLSSRSLRSRFIQQLFPDAECSSPPRQCRHRRVQPCW